MLKNTSSTNQSLQDFLNTDIRHYLSNNSETSAQEKIVSLFHDAVNNVPAYRDFILSRDLDSSSIHNYQDFQNLPLVTKHNYMQAYPLSALCRNGRLEDSDIIACSSGSTGKPMFWPRSTKNELDIAMRFEQIFECAFDAKSKSTLVVICFALGTWVGGIYTMECVRYLAQKGYAVTLVTPGNNKNEIFKVVQELGDYFDQVVLAGYPPFLKDVVDSGLATGIDWALYNMRLIFAGEVFSEEWRSLICKRLGIDNPYFTTASLYGTADAGVLGMETPISISLRRFFAQNPEATKEAFGESRLPTLVQYSPTSRFFELHENTLVVSGDNGIPLIRYHINDKGGVYSYEKLLSFAKNKGYKVPQEFREQLDKASYPLPFVYLFGRSDFTISYFGANIYPENVTVALEKDGITQWVSGKFVLQTVETASKDRILKVVVELASGVTAPSNLEEIIANSVLKELIRLNSEFAHYVPIEFQQPKIILKPAGDSEYFPLGVKHRYTRK